PHPSPTLFPYTTLFRSVLLPRKRDEPVDVVADDGRLGGHRRRHLELLQLFFGLLAGLRRHLLLLDLLFQLLDLVLELVLLTELLDRKSTRLNSSHQIIS